jgi:hypothetical protein
MPSLAHDPAVMLAARAAFALLFANAARHKLRDRAAFAAVLAAYRVLPAALVPTLGVVVAGVELATAAAWLVPDAGELAVVASIALLCVYAVAIGVNLARGRRSIDCGCGVGGAAQPIGEWLLARNALLAVAAWGTLLAGAAAPSVSGGVRLVSATARPLQWIDALTIAGVLAVAASVWTAAHGLAAASARVRDVDVRHARRHGASS